MMTQEQRVSKLSKVAGTLSARAYNPETDYKHAQKWWMQHNQRYISRDILPRIGIVIEQDGSPIAMGWLYITDGNMAQFGWMVAKPDLGPKARVIALTMLLDHAERVARSTGYRVLQMFSDQPTLTKLAVSAGFGVVNQHDFLFKVLVDDDDV